MFNNLEQMTVEKIISGLKGSDLIDSRFLFNQVLVQCEHDDGFINKVKVYLKALNNSVCFNEMVGDFRHLYVNEKVFTDIAIKLFEKIKTLK